MTALTFKIGQEVSLHNGGGEPVLGTVEAYWPDRKNNAHRLVVKTADGGVHLLRSGPNSPIFERQVVDLKAAEAVARAHLNGERISMGIEAQLNCLALAVLEFREKLK